MQIHKSHPFTIHSAMSISTQWDGFPPDDRPTPWLMRRWRSGGMIASS